MNNSMTFFPETGVQLAKYRLELKRMIRMALGIHTESLLNRGIRDASTEELEELYRQHVGPNLPSGIDKENQKG